MKEDEELIAEARGMVDGDSVWADREGWTYEVPTAAKTLIDLADALEAADTRNAELEAERDEHKERSSGRFQAYRAKKIELAAAKRERDAALAVIEQIREMPTGRYGYDGEALDAILATAPNPYRANPEPKGL